MTAPFQMKINYAIVIKAQSGLINLKCRVYYAVHTPSISTHVYHRDGGFEMDAWPLPSTHPAPHRIKLLIAAMPQSWLDLANLFLTA